MNTHLLSSGLLWPVLAVVVIVRQFQPRAVRPLVMVGLPLVAGYLGVEALITSPPHGIAAASLLGVNLVLGVVLGLARGFTVRLWRDVSGTWIMQGTVLTLALWAVTIALKIGLGLATHAAFSTADIALLVGATFAAQGLVVWTRMARPMPVTNPVRVR
jgi:hypothetical protein